MLALLLIVAAAPVEMVRVTPVFEGEQCEKQRRSAKFNATFDRVEIEKVAQTVADATCRTFLIPKRRLGKLSAYGHGLSGEDLLRLFTAGLETQGFSLAPRDGSLEIVAGRATDAGASRPVIAVPLRHANMQQLQPLLEDPPKLSTEVAEPAAVGPVVDTVFVLDEQVAALARRFDAPISIDGGAPVDVKDVRTRGADEVEMPRRVLTAAVANLGALMVRAQATQSTSGLRIGAVPDGTLPAVLGLKVGDLLVRANGVGLGDPRHGREHFFRVRDAERIELELVREGKPLKKTILLTP